MNDTMTTIHELATITPVDKVRVLAPMDVVRLRMAYAQAERSGDLSTRNGAILVDPEGDLIGQGWNGIVPGVKVTPERLKERPLKYQVINHAEDAAIFDAARNGRCTEEATLYCPWYACDRCAAAIIRAGVSKVVGHYDIFSADGETVRNERWDLSLPFQMLTEAGVVIELIRGHLGVEALMDEEIILV